VEQLEIHKLIALDLAEDLDCGFHQVDEYLNSHDSKQVKEQLLHLEVNEHMNKHNNINNNILHLNS